MKTLTQELIDKYQIEIDSMDIEGFFPETIYTFDSDILNIHWANYGDDFYQRAMSDLMNVIEEFEKGEKSCQVKETENYTQGIRIQ